MPVRSIRLPIAGAIEAAAEPELPQLDDLCGPFWALAAVRAFGHRAAGQEEAALAAGTLLRAGAVSSAPDGQPPRRDYRLPLPSTDDPALEGTDVAGVARAVRALSGGALEGVRAVDPAQRWQPATLLDLLGGLAELGAASAVIANVATEHFLAPLDDHAVERHLRSGGLDGFAPSGWRAGHFVALLGADEGPGGAIVRVHDSYPVIGGRYRHGQPGPALAAALRRPGRPPGSLLLVAEAARIPAVERIAGRAGLRVAAPH